MVKLKTLSYPLKSNLVKFYYPYVTFKKFQPEYQLSLQLNVSCEKLILLLCKCKIKELHYFTSYKTSWHIKITCNTVQMILFLQSYLLKQKLEKWNKKLGHTALKQPRHGTPQLPGHNGKLTGDTMEARHVYMWIFNNLLIFPDSCLFLLSYTLLVCTAFHLNVLHKY